MLTFTPREESARIKLGRKGYMLHKGYQPVKGLHEGFMIVDAKHNFAVLGATHWNYDATLKDVEAFITGQ